MRWASRRYFMPVGLAVLVLALLVSAASEGRALPLPPPPSFAIEGHRGGVTALAFSDHFVLGSPDGNRFATGAGNGTVRVWDANSGKMLGELDEFKGISITGLSFSPDGRILAACGKGKAGFWLEKLPSKQTAPPAKRPIAFESGEQFAQRLAVTPGRPKPDDRYKWTPFPSTHADARYADVAVTGDGKEIYFVRRHYGLSYPGRVLRYDMVHELTEERPGPKYLDPRAIACIGDPHSGLAVAYATLEKGEAALLQYGFGETRILTRGVPPIAKGDVPARLAFASDDSWLIAWSGALAAWPLPGSHIISGEPAELPNVYAAAIDKGDLLATAPPPEELRKAEYTFWKLHVQSKPAAFLGVHWQRQSVEVKKVATHPTSLRDISCMAFSPDGRILALGGHTDGVVLIVEMSAGDRGP